MTVPPPRTRTPAPFPFPTWPRHVFVYTVHTQFCVFFTLASHLCWVLFTKRVTQSIAWKWKFDMAFILHLLSSLKHSPWKHNGLSEPSEAFSCQGSWGWRSDCQAPLGSTPWTTFQTSDHLSFFFLLRLHHIKLVIHCLVLISDPLNDKHQRINSHLNVLLLLVSPIPPFSLQW